VASRDPLPAPVRAGAASGPILQWQVGAQPVRGAEPVSTASVAAVGTATAAVAPPVEAPPAANRSAPVTGWVVQIGATASESMAQQMLKEAQDSAGRRLGRVRPVTERVQRGSSTLYRARFAGFDDRSQAEAACAVLKRNDYDCMAIRL
jgi:D-alanyl-D-alanine carboxypeptidase